MICYVCRRAADEDRQDMHCADSGCTCHHKPLDWLEAAALVEAFDAKYPRVGELGKRLTDDA